VGLSQNCRLRLLHSTVKTELDIRLAYQRVRDELDQQRKTDRALAANPYEAELIEVDLDGWLAEVEARVMGDRFVPGPIDVCDAPKGGGLVRPGVRLGIEDRVVYTAAVGACLAKIFEETKWAQGACDFTPRLDPAHLDEREWLRSPFLGWKEFRDRSLGRLKSPSSGFVLTADIAGCFENIEIGLLRSDLTRIGCPQDVVALIGKCLNGWAACSGRGLPQGVLASDLLAKLYLGAFDRRMRRLGLRHMRYMDDVRLFTQTEEEAKRALVEVTRALRVRGLTLQSHKTKIRSADEAVEEFEGVIPVLEKVRRGYIEEVRANGLMAADVSLPMVQIDGMTGEIGVALLHRAFDEFIAGNSQPNRSMLNFVLRRLGKRGDDHAVAECGRLLESNPEHTGSIALYFEELGDPSRLEENVTAALGSETGAIYPHQRYLLLKWLGRNIAEASDSTLHVLRDLAGKGGGPDHVRAVATELLGRFGESSDLEEIETRYRAATDPLERAQLLCCLGRLEPSRRNGLAARVADAPDLLGRAANLARGSSLHAPSAHS
jgi:hypothetical protein